MGPGDRALPARREVLSSARALRFAAATLAVAVLSAWLGFGCGLATSGIPGAPTCQRCSDASQCVPPNACREAVCNASACCEFTPAADGDAPQQIPGDCRTAICAGGEPGSKPDADDLEDDGEPCTTDACEADGTAVHVALDPGTECSIGDATGTCSQEGKCIVLCSDTDPCDPDGNPCTEDVCDLVVGACDYQPLHGIPVPGVMQFAGDCRDRLCVNGKDENVVDDDDLPVDGLQCTVDVCNTGRPGNPPLAVDTPCGPSAIDFCDGGSGCNECNVAAQCYPNDPPDTYCSVRTCTNHGCGKDFQPDGTHVPIQTSFDCNDKVCDGVGGEKNVANAADLPEDNNPCTLDVCSGGVVQHPFVASGLPCGPNSVCNATGQCVGCNAAADCPGTDDYCKTRTCVANVCGYSFTPNGTAFPPAQQTVGDCQQRQCDGTGNEKQVALGSDLPDDANACTNDVCTMGSPSNPPKAINTPCTGPLAPGGGFCDGALTCFQCNTPGQCPTPPVCITNTCAAHSCGTVPTPADTPTATQTPEDCTLMVCDGDGGAIAIPDTGDIPDDDNPCTQDSCNGAMPVHTFVAAGTPCGTNLVCDGAGACGKALGQPCATGGECSSGFCADAVCCNATCNGTCQGCTFALTNTTSGTCANIKPGTEDSQPPCNGPNSCDGAGSCKFDAGQACGVAAQCVSGHCVDGVCCNTACGAICQACTNALTGGTTGVCGNISVGLEDAAPACNGVNSCDGSGNCKKDNGHPCLVAGDCSSGNCADGFCCNAPCTATCKACSAALTGGSDGTCANILPANDDTSCTGTQTCDGSGNCKAKNGQACASPVVCASGSCADGFCCNTGCAGVCMACSAAKKGSGANGTCGTVASGTDPDAECAPDPVASCGNDGTCGAGACRKYVPGTVCAASTCAGTTQQNADTCDGSGSCVDNGSASCLPLVCGPTACLTTCVFDTDCFSNAQYCSLGTCTDKKGPGAPCAVANECGSGLCIDGACCGSDCPACQVCNVSGDGTCTSLGPLVDDTSAPHTCTGANTCDGGGNCKLDNGQPCSLPAECASGVCAGTCQ